MKDLILITFPTSHRTEEYIKNFVEGYNSLFNNIKASIDNDSCIVITANDKASKAEIFNAGLYLISL